MEVQEAITNRWSCRAFKADPVPEDLIWNVLTTASHSPSYTNSQPWEIAVVTGQKLAALITRRAELVSANVPSSPDMMAPAGWPPPHQERARAFAAQRQEVMNTARADPNSKYDSTTQGSPFFGAPCVIIIMIDKTLTEWSIFDIGLFTQSLVLAAHDRGLGTCIQAGAVRYPDDVRKFLGIPDTKKLIVGVSIGYPYTSSKMNALRTPRTDIQELTAWYR